MSRGLHQIATLSAFRVVTRGAQVVAFVILARWLSPQGFGEYGVLTAAVVLATQLGNLGLRQASAFMIGQRRLTDGEATATLCLLWLPLTISTVAAMNWFNADILTTISISSQIAISVAVAFTLLITLLQGVFLGQGDMRNFGLSDAGPRVLLAGITCLLVIANTVSINSALWAFATSFLLIAPLILYNLVRSASSLKPRPRAILPMLRYGILFAISMFLITMNTRIGLFIIHGADDSHGAGLFFAAQRMNELFLEFATVVGLTLFARTTQSSAITKTIAATARVCAWMFWCFLAISLAMIIATPFLIQIFLGSAYSDATAIVRILAISLAPAAIVKIMNGVIAGAGRPYLSAAIVGLGVALNAAATLSAKALAPETAAAVGLVAGYFFMFLSYILCANRLYSIPMTNFILPSTADRLAVVASIKRRVKLTLGRYS